MYRLVIDIPMGEDLELAKKQSLWTLREIQDKLTGCGFILKYRLQDDNDRSAHNYLEIDENGHASGQKSVLVL